MTLAGATCVVQERFTRRGLTNARSRRAICANQWPGTHFTPWGCLRRTSSAGRSRGKSTWVHFSPLIFVYWIPYLPGLPGVSRIRNGDHGAAGQDKDCCQVQRATRQTADELRAAPPDSKRDFLKPRHWGSIDVSASGIDPQMIL